MLQTGPLKPVPHPSSDYVAFPIIMFLNKNSYLIKMIGMKRRPIPSHIDLSTSYSFLCIKLIHEIVN